MQYELPRVTLNLLEYEEMQDQFELDNVSLLPINGSNTIDKFIQENYVEGINASSIFDLSDIALSHIHGSDLYSEQIIPPNVVKLYTTNEFPSIEEKLLEGDEEGIHISKQLELHELSMPPIPYSNSVLQKESSKINEYPGSERSHLQRSNLEFTENSDMTYSPSTFGSANDSHNNLVDLPVTSFNEKKTAATSICVPSVEDGCKKNFCLFCSKLVTKIVRHMVTVHKNEIKVKRFSSLPKRSAERKKITKELINEANFKYNTSQLLYSGKLVVKRRPHKGEKRTEKHYFPCGNCKGFFSKLNIRNHFRNCTGRQFLGSKLALTLSRRLRGSLHEKSCPLLKNKIFRIIREDEAISEIRYDELLILYANELCIEFASRPQCYAMIRNKIRKMACFLRHMKMMDPNIEKLSDVFRPKYYDKMVDAINLMGNRDAAGVLHTPSTAQDMGTQLKIMAEILKAENIKNSDEDILKETENMIFLMKQGIRIAVNVGVKDARIDRMRNKEIILPITEDITKLMDYLYKNQSKYFKLVTKEKFKLENWRKLAEFTLLCIQTFNRRRPGETERMLITDFEKREAISEKTNKDLYNALTEEEKQMVNKYCRFECRGKLNKNIAILINREIEQSILTLLQFRKRAKVPSDNPYIFGMDSIPNRSLNLWGTPIAYIKAFIECQTSVRKLLELAAY